MNTDTVLDNYNRWGDYRLGNANPWTADEHVRRPVPDRERRGRSAPASGSSSEASLPPCTGAAVAAAPLSRSVRTRGDATPEARHDAASSLASSRSPAGAAGRARRAATAPKGHLVLIGGGDKPPEAMRKFVELAGGPQAPDRRDPDRLRASPTPARTTSSSSRRSTAAPNVVALDDQEQGGRDAPRLRRARAARRRASSSAAATRSGSPTRSSAPRSAPRSPTAFARGAVIGGTSAGTACQSDPMITGEGDFTVIRAQQRRAVDGPRLLPRGRRRPALHRPAALQPAALGDPRAPRAARRRASTRTPRSGSAPTTPSR